jgi:hypothetical protein
MVPVPMALTYRYTTPDARRLKVSETIESMGFLRFFFAPGAIDSTALAFVDIIFKLIAIKIEKL